MADIRKRTGKKGTTYQVRYPSNASKSGFAFKTFVTLNDARNFAKMVAHDLLPIGRPPLPSMKAYRFGSMRVRRKDEAGVGRLPPYTLKTHRYRADIIKAYSWPKPLAELAAPDVVQFRSWLLQNHSRDQARKALSYFHSMVLELVNRGAIHHDFASGVGVSKLLPLRRARRYSN